MSRSAGRALACLGLLAAISSAATASARGAGLIGVPPVVPPQLRPLIAARMNGAAEERRATWLSRFDLQARGGYRVTVVAARGVVALEVTEERRSGSHAALPVPGQTAITAYVAHGVVKPNRVEASFGRFGRVAVRFRPTGRVVKSPPGRHCRGPDHYTTRRGVFVGSIRFTGEDRYLRLRAKRAKGRTRRPLRLRCASRRRAAAASRVVGDFPYLAPGALEAGWREPLAATELLALRFGKAVLYFASTEESMGTVAEVRFAFAVAPSKTFTQNEALTTARLAPPWPFVGTGRYGAAADGTTTWTGGLRAAFPGERVRLTGPEFKVRLESGV